MRSRDLRVISAGERAVASLFCVSVKRDSQQQGQNTGVSPLRRAMKPLVFPPRRAISLSGDPGFGRDDRFFRDSEQVFSKSVPHSVRRARWHQEACSG